MKNGKQPRKAGYYVLALLLIALGTVFIICNNSLIALGITIGILLALFGAIYGVITIADKDRGFIFAVKVVFCAICLICGILTAIFNEGAVEIIAAIFALLLIIDGAFKLTTAALCRKYTVKLWWIILIPALVSIAGSFWMIKYPPQDPTWVSVILGILFIIEAAANIMSAPLSNLYEKSQEENMRAKFATESAPEENSNDTAHTAESSDSGN